MASVDFTLRLLDRISSPARSAGKSLDRVEDKLRALKRAGQQPLIGSAMQRFPALTGAASRFGSVAMSAVTNVAGIVLDLASKVAMVGAAFTAAATAAAFFFTKAVVQAGAFRQSSERAFDVLFGAGQGGRVFEKARRLSLQFGESLQTTVEGLRDLKAAGISESDGESLFKGIQDLQAIGGAGSTDVGRFLLALNQIKSNGKLAAEELNQLGEASKLLNKGDIKRAIAGRMDVTMDEFNKLQQQGKVGADVAIQGIIDTMKQVSGGKLGDLAEKASRETFSGAMRALGNLPGLIFDDIAQNIDLKPLTAFVNRISDALKSPEAQQVTETLGKITQSVLRAATAIGSSLGDAFGIIFKDLFSKSNQKDAVTMFSKIATAVEQAAPAIREMGLAFRDGIGSESTAGSMQAIANALDQMSPGEKQAGFKALVMVFRALGMAIGFAVGQIASIAAGMVGLVIIFTKVAEAVDRVVSLLREASAAAEEFSGLQGAGKNTGYGGMTGEVGLRRLADDQAQPGNIARVAQQTVENRTVNDQRAFSINVSNARSNSDLAALIEAAVKRISPVSL